MLRNPLSLRRRREFIAIAFALLATAGVASGEEPLPVFGVTNTLQPRDPLAPQPRLLPDGTPMLADVKYATIGGYRPLRLDLYGARESGPPRPLVAYLHGGGWYTGTPRSSGAFTHFPDVLAAVADRGYVVAAIEYRLSGEARFPAQVEDVRAALQFLADHAARYGIDAGRIALWGVSAGTHLAALAASGCPAQEPARATVIDAAAPAPGASGGSAAPCVAAVVGWSGLYRLTGVDGTEPPTAAARALLGCADTPCDGRAIATASPYDQVHAAAPPTLLLHGTADTLVNVAQSERYAERLRAAGTKVELVLLPNVGHGFIGATQAATLEASTRAVTTTLEFLDRTLRRD
jgi:acetyl esterase/lipase